MSDLERIEAAMEEKVRPALRSHGGDISIDHVEGKTVYVKLLGQCAGCPSAEVTKLGNYKGVEVKRESTEVTDEEVDQKIQSILDANPEYVEITDSPAQNGDTVDIDYVGMKDGVAFDGGTAQGYKLELGSGTFIDGFEDGLVGASVGQELSLNLTFPENYGNSDLAGQAVVFDVTVNAIEEKKDAVLDDNFVQRVSDFKTVDEFRADKPVPAMLPDMPFPWYTLHRHTD